MNQRATVFVVGVVLVGCTCAIPCRLCAGVTSAAVRETVEFMTRRFAKEAAQEGAESLARRTERLCAAHGDDVLQVARKAGPEGIKAVESAGQHGDDVVKLLVRHGDEALWITAKPGRLALFLRHGDDASEAMLRHRELAATIIEQFGTPGARAVKQLHARNARRLAILADEGRLGRWGRTDELLDVLSRHGDRAMDFVWRNKGALAVTATLAAFLADPEPFLNGTRELAQTVGESVAGPLAEASGNVAAETARRVPGTILALLAFVAAGGFWMALRWNPLRWIRA